MLKKYQITPGGKTVIDLGTGLEWQRFHASERKTFQEAVQYCTDLELNGHRDWVLPSIHALFGLVEHTIADPAIDSDAFPATVSAGYWTGTAAADHQSGSAWRIDFSIGQCLTTDKHMPHRVRAVRVADKQIEEVEDDGRPPNDIVKAPSHYTWIPEIECKDVTKHFLAMPGSAIKYIWRHGLKIYHGKTWKESAVVDLRKACECLEVEIARFESLAKK